MNCLDLSADLDLCFLGLGMESREALLSWEPTDPRLWSVEESAGEHIGNGEYTGVRIKRLIASFILWISSGFNLTETRELNSTKRH